MASGIYVAMGGARMQEHRLETLTNNLANAGTAGFKRHGTTFRQVHEDTARMGDPNQAMGLHHPVRFLPEDRLPGQLDERFTNWSEGPLKQTGNSLDVAIQGEGFLVVQSPTGPVYTRNGTLQMQADGGLVTQQGFAVLDPDGLPILLPPDAGRLTISPDGDMMVGEQAAGRLAVVRFDDLQQLERLGNDNYRPYDPATQVAQPIETPRLHQGYLEGSNVNPIETMALLIKTSRAFELNTRALQAYKSMDDAAVQKVGRSG